MKKNLKILYLLLFVFSLTSTNIFGESSTLSRMKENYKYEFIAFKKPAKSIVVRTGDRIEADALLELATEGYKTYDDFLNNKKEKLSHNELVLLIMPRIDILENNWHNLAKTTDKMLVFIMKKDKLDGEYGDRSYETYLSKGLDKKIPKNTKVYSLEDDSVSRRGVRNNFEISDILKSKVFKKQIENIYLEELKKIKKKKNIK